MAKTDMQQEDTGMEQSHHKRLIPPLTFVLALCLLVVCCYDSNYRAMQPVDQRYEQAKNRLSALRLDDRNGFNRKAWEELHREFVDIHDADPNWVNSAAALFRAAESLEELARRSCTVEDARLAVQCYEAVPANHAQSRLADDALYKAAMIRATHLRDEKGALELVERIRREYPKGDMLEACRTLEKALHASARGRTAPETRKLARATAVDVPEGKSARNGSAKAQSAPADQPGQDKGPTRRNDNAKRQATATASAPQADSAKTDVQPVKAVADTVPKAAPRPNLPEVQMISWHSPDRQSVEIVLETSAPVRYRTRMGAGRNNPQIWVDLDKAAVAGDMRDGATIQGSLLTAISVREHEQGGVRLQFDFRDVKSFDASSEDDPCRIVLRVAAGKAQIRPKGKVTAFTLGEPMPAPMPEVRKASLEGGTLSAMADQLGLTVQTVYIDAGHGGRDPGTSHNNVLERAVTLDVATALGRLLEARGLTVVHSRTRDNGIGLSERTRRANEVRADLFVSIHVNANEDRSINGFETYYLDLARNSQAARVAALENAMSDRRLGDMQNMLADVMLNARVDESRRLAADVQRMSLACLKRNDFYTRNNGVKSAPFHVLIGAQMPAVLVELGYCTNAAEAANLANPQYRQSLAEGLAEGILAYRNRLQRHRTAQNSLTVAASSAM